MITLHQGDCVEVIKTLPAASVDCVITDPPYPEIDRDYGRMTEAAWFDMMKALVPEVRRVLKPQGSAVFILQPNSEKVGKMRLWLWDFMSWVGREWGIVQDAYWWNHGLMPLGGANTGGLMRGSVKTMVWAGDSKAYRNQDAVLWRESDANIHARTTKRAGFSIHPSGRTKNAEAMAGAAARRGGVSPFNLIPFSTSNNCTSAGAFGHGAGTPIQIADWWTRYICPTGGVVFDPFMGSGTMGLAAIRNECRFIGIERMEKYYEVAKTRIEAERDKPRTMRMELA